MQSEYIHASHEWEREQASYREQIDQLHMRLAAFKMDTEDAVLGLGGEDV